MSLSLLSKVKDLADRSLNEKMPGKITRFDIIFSNPNNAFYAGQTVTGKVVVEITESMKIRAVKLRYVGEAAVNFNDGKMKKNHVDNQKYFEQLDLIFGSEGTPLKADSSLLNAGIHEFPFVFNLPGQLPSSFESNMGHVRYFCKAYLHRPWKFDFTAKKAFTVVSVVDLNKEPAAFTPGYLHADRRFSFSDRFLSCIKGGLVVNFRINRCAYVPGEAILINAEIDNNSSVRVKNVECYLQQNLIFSSKSGNKFCRGETKIGLISQGEVKRSQSQIWNNDALTIPALPPTKLGGCRLISVDYLLNFVIFVDNAPNIVLTMPIILGTIPLQPVETAQEKVRPTVLPTAPAYAFEAPSLSTPSAPPLTDFHVPPPPSYEECVDGVQVDIQDKDDNEFTYGQLSYRPLYPTFTIRRPAAAASAY